MELVSKRIGPLAVAFLALVACSSPTVIAETPTQPPPDTTTPPDTSSPPDTSHPPPSGLSVTVKYATFVGGTALEEAREPVIFPDGRLLFGMRTYSSNMPASAGAIQSSFGGGGGDTFVAVLSADGSTLLAGTYLGGSGQERPPYGMELTSDGDIVLTSGTDSPNFPITSGAHRPSKSTNATDGYVCRISPDLTTRRWCSYVGAWPRGGLALTSNNEPIIVGFAVSGSAFSPSGGAFQTSMRGRDDAFVLKLNASGTAQVWGTYLGGTGSAEGEGALSVNVNGSDVLVGGIAQSSDFPVTAGAHQSSGAGLRDGFFARLSSDGRQLRYGTLIGGSGQDEAKHRNHVLADGSVILGGEFQSSSVAGASGGRAGPASGWVGKLSPNGSFDFLRYIGGNGWDRVVDRAADAAGRIYVVGSTTSSDFPVTAGALQTQYGGNQDGFFAILDQTGAILYATYIGGSGLETLRGVEVGPDGSVYLVGGTQSSNFPVTSGAFQTTRGGDQDGYAIRLSISP